MVEGGFYVIKDSYFKLVEEPYLRANKYGNRPHYYCFKDNKTGLYWMIPLSSKVDKYKRIIEKRQSENKSCDTIHIIKTDNGRMNVFLIADMFPVTEEYIEREYAIAGNHLKVTSEHEIREISRKAKKILGMLKQGVRFTPSQPDINKIKKLLANNKDSTY
ncbi:MAG: hypothetical protein IJP13_00165 [Lachnospiraceae bacterium]|nr:hypothetical protein [Lachnospiraceae bacterium]